MLDSQRQDDDRSRLSEAQARFEDLNADLILKARSVLNGIVSSPEVHPKLINTLSMLEHMGSHKIMATQHGQAIDQSTLRHLAEECHHAFFMKRQAEKAAGRRLEYEPEDLLAPASARMYFQRLEASLTHRLEQEGSAGAAYLYMSMIIEFRAVWSFVLYQKCLDKANIKLSLKSLLAEEQGHLEDMETTLAKTGIGTSDRINKFLLHAPASTFLRGNRDRVKAILPTLHA